MGRRDENSEDYVNSITRTAILVVALFAALAFSEESKVRIGVLPLESYTGNDDSASELTGVLIKRFDEMGFYEVLSPEKVERGLSEIQIGMPKRFKDPRLILDLGRALRLDRVVYGSVDMNSSRAGVRLALMDIVMGQTVEDVSIEGAEGVSAREVLLAAISKLHGLSCSSQVKAYYGPQVDNKREAGISSALVQGAGLVFGLVNYGHGGEVGTAEFSYRDDPLSGIPASADQIAMFSRPAALANAYVAASDDAYGVLYNPAGMAWVGGRDAAAAYQYRFGLDLLAASYVNKATREIGFGQALFYSADREGALTELYFVTAAAYKFNQNYLLRPFSLGASLKILGSSVKALSPDSPEGRSFGAGLDLGFMWELSKKIRYGLLLRDVPVINRWKNKTTGETYYEPLASTLHMGGSFQATYSTYLIAEGQIPLYSDQPWIMSGGIEYEFYRVLMFRIGLQKEIMNAESTWWKMTGGLGFKVDTEPLVGRELQLDVSYEYNTLSLFPVVNVSARAGF